MARALLALLGVLILRATSAHAFVCLTNGSQCLHWNGGQATLKSFLGNPGMPLINGTFNWDQNAINAANDWTAVGAAFHFNVQVGGDFFPPCGAAGAIHACPNTGPVGDNPVMFASNFCGRDFGDIIELTNNCWDIRSGAMLNAPVFVNGNVDGNASGTVNVQWNAYDGAIRFANGKAVNDIRRVLLHEFGHVLGLDHPDDHGQDRVAIMNSHESNIDRLQQDDISGIFAIYPNGGPPPSGSGTTTGCQIAMSDHRGGAWVWGTVVVFALWATFSRRRRSTRYPPR